MARDARILRDERIAHLVQAGWDAYHAGRERWLYTVIARLQGMVQEAPEILDLQWRLHFLRGHLDLAMEEARRGAELYPDDAALQHSAGWCLLELGDAFAATPFLERACALDADHADAWYDLGIARENLGDDEGLRQAFARTWECDRAAHGSLPSTFQPEEFHDILRASIEEIPQEVRDAMDNVVVILEDYPEAWVLEEPPYDPRLFGLFVGPVYADIRSNQTGMEQPPRIYVFQRNLERQFRHPDDLAAEIRVTLIHEVGHYLGLEEADLAERGWL